MADDTVEQARQDALAIVGTGTDTFDLRVRLDKALDALIAAVRAEQRDLVNRNAAAAVIAAQDAGYVLAKPDESS